MLNLVILLKNQAYYSGDISAKVILIFVFFTSLLMTIAFGAPPGVQPYREKLRHYYQHSSCLICRN